MNVSLMKQEAPEGIYKSIGDGLRRRPDLLNAAEEFGVQRVLNGTSAYIRVHL